MELIVKVMWKTKSGWLSDPEGHEELTTIFKDLEDWGITEFGKSVIYNEQYFRIKDTIMDFDSDTFVIILEEK